MGECALSMEGMLVATLDTQGCSNTQAALSIITTLIGGKATLKKIKEDLDDEEKRSTKLQDNVTKLEERKTRLLKDNCDLKLSKKNIAADLNKQNHQPKGKNSLRRRNK